MGTSSTFDGPNNDRPLVPSFVDDSDRDDGAGDDAGEGQDGADSDSGDGGHALAAPPLPPPGPAGRFTAPRANFTTFARSGGTDRRSLGRAVSGYVRSSMGSPRSAAQRMGPARASGGNVVRMLQSVQANGIAETLRELNLTALAGRPIEEVFAGLADYVCPEDGSIDQGIARNAFIETIADLAEAGITDIDGLTSEQMTTVFELYVAHTIEARICNDIGTKAVALPANPAAAQKVEDMLHDFILRGVTDAVVRSGSNIQTLSPDQINGFVTSVYEDAFQILQAMGDAEAAR
ncbi:Qat anti-phage system associated protein QatB [Asaia bogorensis]|uniref:Qat anti-phage system associated protein QatB n=1 Tax=Asaia bogorensis TaxID=91915 RepID=UPI0030184E1F